MKTSTKKIVTNDTSQAIINGTLSVIAEEGLAGLTTKSVSERVSVSTAAIHYFFDTKENLIYSAFVYVIKTVREQQLQIRQSEPDPLERIKATIGVFFGKGLASDYEASIWPQIWVYALRDEKIGRLFQAYNSRLISNFISDISAMGVDRPRARTLAFKLNSLHRGLWIDQQIGHLISEEEIQDVLNTFFEEIQVAKISPTLFL